MSDSLSNSTDLRQQVTWILLTASSAFVLLSDRHISSAALYGRHSFSMMFLVATRRWDIFLSARKRVLTYLQICTDSRWNWTQDQNLTKKHNLYAAYKSFKKDDEETKANGKNRFLLLVLGDKSRIGTEIFLSFIELQISQLQCANKSQKRHDVCLLSNNRKARNL